MTLKKTIVKVVIITTTDNYCDYSVRILIVVPEKTPSHYCCTVKPCLINSIAFCSIKH